MKATRLIVNAATGETKIEEYDFVIQPKENIPIVLDNAKVVKALKELGKNDVEVKQDVLLSDTQTTLTDEQ